MTRLVTGDVPPAAFSWVSNPLRTEHSPLRSLPPATLVGFRARFAGSIALTVPNRDCTVGDSGFALAPAAPEAAATLLQTDEADGSGPPSRLWRTAVRLRLMETLARLPVPDAVGFPLPSSDADAVPHETLTSSSPVSIGTVHELDPVGVAVTPSPLATASCVVVDATPESDEDGDVGHGFVEEAVERQAPVPDASAIGALLASAAEPPPANCRVSRRSNDTNPPLDSTPHVVLWAPALPDTADTSVMATRATAAILIRPLMRYP